MADYTLSSKITGDSSSFEKAFSKAEESAKGFKSKMSNIAGKLDVIGGKMQGIGVKISAASIPLVLFGKKSVEYASDLQESQNVIDVTFGESAKTINKWAKDAGDAYGMSELQAKKYTGTMGAMLKSMDMTDDAVVNMSTSMTGLAGDMASFYNLPIEEAFGKIRAGIAGETEPLKQLGINMSVANLEAYALAQGLDKSYDSMTQAEQATLRYNYLMQATADAQGDFARTGDSYANQGRKLELAISNLSQTVGEILLPYFLKGVQVAQNLIAKFQALDPSIQSIIVTAAALLPVIGAVFLVLGTVTKAVSGLAKTIEGLSKGVGMISKVFTFFTSPAGLVVLAIAAIIAIGVLLIKNWDTIKAKASAVWDYVTGKFAEFSAFIKGIFTTDWSESFGLFGDILNGFLANVSSVFDAVKQVFSGIVDFVAGVFTGDWSRAWQGIVNIFGGIMSGLASIVKAPLNAVISLINGAIGGLNRISVSIPDWVPGLGGRKFGVNIPKIPYLLHGTDDWKGGFARMNEGGRGELTYLPNGTQVIPHDISVKYAKEAARATTTSTEESLGILEGLIINIFNNTSVDGTPLKETLGEYVIEKIGNNQSAGLRARGY